MIDCRQFQIWMDETGLGKVIEMNTFDVSSPDSLASAIQDSDPMFEHLAVCAACSRRWHEAQEAWLAMAVSLDPLPVDSALESSVMNRVRNAGNSNEDKAVSADGASHNEGGVTSNFFAKAEFWRYVVAATVLAALATFVIVRPTAHKLNGSKPTAEELATIEEFARQMDRLDELQHAFGSAELHFVSFVPTDAKQKVHGYIVYDIESNEGHFFGFDLNLHGEQYYKLSLLNESDKVVSSAVINLDSRKQLGSAVIKLPADVSSLREAIVTLEDRDDDSREGSHSDQIVMRTKVAL